MILSNNNLVYIKKARAVLLFLPFLFSCATYNTKLSGYYKNIEKGNYTAAKEAENASTFLQQERNKLLYYMERGKLYHLLQAYDSSNYYFNRADEFIEIKRKTAGDLFVSNLLNPMMQTYLGEDFERFMIHYYKALNYLYLSDRDNARVEARRITLSTNAQEEKFRIGSDRYKEDAFALSIQGMIYELNGENNNAFISYRNAVDLYLKNNNQYYGVGLPKQLLQDLYRTAALTGFTDQINIYEKNTGIRYANSHIPEGGELIVFYEKGMAPVKVDNAITVTNDGLNGFFFNGPYGMMTIPYNYGGSGWYNNRSINQFRLFRVAIPGYQERQYKQDQLIVRLNDTAYYGELTHNINVLASQVLNERMLKEVADALIRAVVKKGAEYGVSEAARAAGKSGDKKDDKQKQREGETAALAAGLIMNIFNSATEKADTRNWQSLPAFIQYVRIPLKKGSNEITLQSSSGKKIITVNGNGGLQMINWCATN
jgi:hypothetical protein